MIPHLNPTLVRDAIKQARLPGVLVGLEHWDALTLVELTTGHTPEWNLTEAVADHTDQVLFMISRNPNNAPLERRMTRRLAFQAAIGRATVEWITFGEMDALPARFDWVQRYVFNGSLAALREQTKNGSEWYNHGYGPLACFTSFVALHHFLNHSLQYRYALLLETDAVPVHRFGVKFRDLLAQLERRGEFDVLHVGTCAGRGFREYTPVVRNLVSPYSLPTRCFCAVMFSRRGAAKVIAAGAVMGGRFRNCDHLFNALTPALNLSTLWVQPPLFSEESKTKTRFFCPGDA